MAKIKWTEEKIAQMVKEGYGDGDGAEYKPWLDVHSLSSRGRVRRVKGHLTGRVHHLFSDVEYHVFLGAEWARNVVDIKEQYPLDRDLTRDIALEQKIKHPTYPGTGVDTVMTVDFLLTVRRSGEDTYLALNAKRGDEAENARSMEKLELQRCCFQELGVPHHVIYHSLLPTLKIRNLAWIRAAYPSEDEYEPNYKGYYLHHADRMREEFRALRGTNQADMLHAYCSEFDERHGAEPGTGLRAARMLMQDRTLTADLNSPDLAAEPLHKFFLATRFDGAASEGG